MEDVVENEFTLKTNPFVVNSELQLPASYNFRRHFTIDGRYFFRLNSEGVASYTRTDTMNGDILIYTPTEDKEHEGMKQLHYVREISDEHGIMVFLQSTGKRALSTFIALIHICHKSQKFTLLSKANFKSFNADNILQATLIQNSRDWNQIACVFTEYASYEYPVDRTCFAFFKVRNSQIFIEKVVYMKTAVYFPYWHGDFIDGLGEENGDLGNHNLQRYDIRGDTVYCLEENFLEFLEDGEYINDFCWYKNNLYMFILTNEDSKVYVRKFNTIVRKWERIDLSIDDFAAVNRQSRFFINFENIICYCETVLDANNETQTDRFIRIAMKKPDKLLTLSWICMRDAFEKKKKSFLLPFTFEFQSPIRQLLDFNEEKIEIDKHTIIDSSVDGSESDSSIGTDMETAKDSTSAKALNCSQPLSVNNDIATDH